MVRVRTTYIRIGIVVVLIVIVNINWMLWKNSHGDHKLDLRKRVESLPFVQQMETELQRIEENPIVKRMEEEFSHLMHMDRHLPVEPTLQPLTITGQHVDSVTMSNPTSYKLPKASTNAELKSAATTASTSVTTTEYIRSGDPIDTTLLEDHALPAFASDSSEFIFGSMIERVIDSWDLHITTMMLCHFMMEPSNSATRQTRIHPAMKSHWRKAMHGFRNPEVHYNNAGIRKQERQVEKFYCQISYALQDNVMRSYDVQGIFMPNKLTVDANANQRLDILRCPLRNPYGSTATWGDGQALYHLYGSKYAVGHVKVKIMRGLGNNSTTLISFSIPWKTRRTGFLLSIPPAATQLDAWKGHVSQSNTPPSISTIDHLHVCVPATSQYPTKKVLPMFMEFISHNVLLGADHIHFPVPFGWGSYEMNTFVSVFQSYINEGKLSIIGQAWDGLEKFPSVLGIELIRHNLKLIQIQTCLYFAKGMSQYLAIFDADEFFLPQGVHTTYRSILSHLSPSHIIPEPSAYPPTTLEKMEQEFSVQKGGGRGIGWADKDGHPYCYFAVESYILTKQRRNYVVDPHNPWLGVRYPHGPEPTNDQSTRKFRYSRIIIPADRIFQATFNLAGACKLPLAWTTCYEPRQPNSMEVLGPRAAGMLTNEQKKELVHAGNEHPQLQTFDFKSMIPRKNVIRDITGYTVSDPNTDFCITDETRPMSKFREGGRSVDFRIAHNFDEVVLEGDGYQLNPQQDGLLYHFQVYRDDLSASDLALVNQSLYATKYYPHIMKDLRQRGLDIVVTIDNSDKDKSEQHEIAGQDKVPKVDELWKNLFNQKDIDGDLEADKQQAQAVPPSKLPQNFSHRAMEDEIVLPNFAQDFSEFALGSMIERASDMWDLHITTFFLCHGLLEPKVGGSAQSGDKISPEVHDVWKQAMNHFKSTTKKGLYTANGIRQQVFSCRITNGKTTSGHSESYIVTGAFVGNKLTPDANSNRRMDIFRCAMKDSKRATMDLARGTDDVLVEILRGSVSLLKFRVPWSTRFDPSTPGKWTHDRVYLCVPGWEDLPSKASMPLLVEWAQHHLLQGVDHIFIGVLLAWGSQHMNVLRRVVSSFVEEGTLSVTSHAGDGFDLVYSTGGLSWGRDNVKNFYVNMCTYYAKGTSDYVGVWDFDEFFIPRGGYRTIPEVLKLMESPRHPLPYSHVHKKNTDSVKLFESGWKGGPGLADGDGHPFCYLLLNSEVTLVAQKVLLQPGDIKFDQAGPRWMGQRFNHGTEPYGHHLGFKKSLRPTRTIFQGGLHMAGACHLPPPWNGCPARSNPTHHCLGMEGEIHRFTKFPNGSAINFHLNHFFDEVVMDEDAKLIDSDQIAYINHMQIRRQFAQATEQAIAAPSEYTTQFYPTVKDHLEMRGLVMPFELPEIANKPFPEPDDTWVDIEEVHRRIDTQKTNHSISTSSILTEEEEEKEKNGKKASEDDDQNKNTDKNQDQEKEDDKEGGIRWAAGFSTLPAHANDLSEFFLASMIERVSDSWDLYITTFLLQHDMLNLDSMNRLAFAVRDDPITLKTWSKTITEFEKTKYQEGNEMKDRRYLPSGARHPNEPPFYCKITNQGSAGGVSGGDVTGDSMSEGKLQQQSYIVPGEFLPNRLTPDPNANKRLDVLRCKMEYTQQAYLTLARSNEEVIVEIFRPPLPSSRKDNKGVDQHQDKDSTNSKNEKIDDGPPLIKFSIPWRTRVQSSYLTHPPGSHVPTITTPTSRDKNSKNNSSHGSGSSYVRRGSIAMHSNHTSSSTLLASIFDPWKGFDHNRPGVWTRDRMYMCVPGMESPPSRKYLPVYLEFIQHHLLLGVTHMFLSSPFAWGGNMMTSLLRILRSFVEDGSVSMSSMADDKIDFLYSTRGLSWMRDNPKVFQVNFCTYFSKGMADYVGIWDFDEFFIPKSPHRTLMDVLDTVQAPSSSSSSTTTKQSSKHSTGYAKGGGANGVIEPPPDTHPFCYLQLKSSVLANREDTSNVDWNHLWIGQRFAHATEPPDTKVAKQFSFKKSIIPTANMWQMGLHMSGACSLPYPWNGCPQNRTQSHGNHAFCYLRDLLTSTIHGDDSIRRNNSISTIINQSSSISTSSSSSVSSELDQSYLNIDPRLPHISRPRSTQAFDEMVAQEDTRWLNAHTEGELFHIMLYRHYHAVTQKMVLNGTNDYTKRYFPATLAALRQRKLDLLIDIPAQMPFGGKTVRDGWTEYDLIYQSRDVLGSLFPFGHSAKNSADKFGKATK